jgi:hypothetical protein
MGERKDYHVRGLMGTMQVWCGMIQNQSQAISSQKNVAAHGKIHTGFVTKTQLALC